MTAPPRLQQGATTRPAGTFKRHGTCRRVRGLPHAVIAHNASIEANGARPLPHASEPTSGGHHEPPGADRLRGSGHDQERSTASASRSNTCVT